MFSWNLYNPSKGILNISTSSNSVTFFYPCVSFYDCTYYYATLSPGYYKVEVWGAKGGGAFLNNVWYSGISPGGYSVGVMELTESTLVNVYVGGKGEDPTNPSLRDAYGGYNGGGSSPQDNDSDKNDAGGGGGGASDIRVGSTSLNSRIIVAGGGGGNGYFTVQQKWSNIGFGGGVIGGQGKANSGTGPEGGSQTNGYSFGCGENGMYDGGSSGGGGGGYWGGFSISGGGGAHAGGGSGYIGGVISYGSVERATLAGNTSFYNANGDLVIGNYNHGSARITLLQQISATISISPTEQLPPTSPINYSIYCPISITSNFIYLYLLFLIESSDISFIEMAFKFNI